MSAAKRKSTVPRAAKDLKEKPDNPRTATDAKLDALRRAMQKYGDLSGVIFNRRTGHLIGGHQRLKQIPKDAKITYHTRLRTPNAQGTTAHGWLDVNGERWAYREVDVDRKTENEMNVRANQAAGEWSEAIGPLLRAMREEGSQMDLLGFDEKQLGRLIEIKRTEGGEVPEPPTGEPPAKPRSKAGQIYELGPHRLLCGDCRKEDLVRRLAEDRTADVVYTDPPYSVDYEARSGKHKKIEGDDKRRDALVKDLLLPAFRAAAAIAKPHAAWYIWHATSTRQDFLAAMTATGLLELQNLVWIKPAMVVGWGHYRWSHEPLFYAARAGESPAWYGGRDQPTVWRIGVPTPQGIAIALAPALLLTDGHDHQLYLQAKAPKGKKVRHVRVEDAAYVLPPDELNDAWEISREQKVQHPTQKPVACAHRALVNSSKDGDTVYDAFAGRGNTLLAAELLGRRALVVEKDRGYCDVIRQRYADLVGEPQHSPIGALTTPGGAT